MDAREALKVTNRLFDKLANRRTEVSELMKYAAGEHPLKYATKEWSKEHASRYQGFSDNWCGTVAEAPTDLTKLSSFRVGTDADALSRDERELMDAWKVNDGEAQSMQGFLSARIAKRSYALVWGDDDDEPVMTWERADQMIVEYDPENPRRRLHALKAWREDDVEYATLYTPTEVWKWQRKTQQTEKTSSGLLVVTRPTSVVWDPREKTGDDTWPIENPLGRVPVVEFPNRPVLGGEPLSDIAGARAAQDADNLMWAYLFNAADYASMPARVVMGQAPPKLPKLDENGQKIGDLPVDTAALKAARMMWLTGEKTTIGQWDAAKLDVFTNVTEILIRHLSAQTRTPITLIHGELGNVNGETVTAIERPLRSRAREANTYNTSPMRELFSLFALVRNNAGLAKACRSAEVGWSNPDIDTDAQISDAALKDRQVGLSMAGILEKRYGMTQTEIDLELARQRDEQSDPTLERLSRDTAAFTGV